jgi:hypothetical protein
VSDDGPMFVAWFSLPWLKAMKDDTDVVRENDGIIDVFVDTPAAPPGRYYVFHIGEYDCLAERREVFTSESVTTA